MFGFFTDAVAGVLDTAETILSGELPSNRQIAKLVDAGLTVYAISEITGLATSAVEKLIEDGN